MIKETNLTPFSAMEKAAECLKILAHPARLRIIEVLSISEITVGELAEICGLTQPATSEHLRLLKDKGFLEKRRESRKIYYSISENHLLNILGCIHDRYGGEKS